MSPILFEDRTRIINAHHENGQYIMYWMRTAVRTDHNPALIRALELAQKHNLPFFVYHAISEHYPFASRRHHQFILEGAKDITKKFKDLDISYYFHIEREGHRGPHLQTLASNARVVITEEMPVPFLRFWTDKVALDTGVCFHLVDTSCVVPMMHSKRAPTRAFQFRDQYTDIRTHNLRTLEFPNLNSYTIPPLKDFEVPFTPVDLSTEDFTDILNHCDIDHSVFPVTDTIGGSTHAQKRWAQFKKQGLRQYHNRRNNPTQNGVSRLSAYFHYGMISTFQVAQESQSYGKGGEKFLDELLIWRELAYHWCYHIQKPQHWTALPTWAQQTLQQHDADAREYQYSWQTLRYAETDDALWNDCQNSLNRHGELHNNLRMTWGKQLRPWVDGSKKALRMVLDLNNRLALDGRDPASYGGILWCFGLFDRPFKPDKPIWGTVRTRNTEGHTGRLNHSMYNQHIRRQQHTPVDFHYDGDGFVGALLYRILNQYGLNLSISTDSTLVLPTNLESKSTVERLEVRSWQDAGWIDIKGNLLTWTDNGIQFWKSIWDQAIKSPITQNTIRLSAVSNNTNPVRELQSILKMVHQHLQPVQNTHTEQMTLW